MGSYAILSALLEAMLYSLFNRKLYFTLCSMESYALLCALYGKLCFTFRLLEVMIYSLFYGKLCYTFYFMGSYFFLRCMGSHALLSVI